MYIREKKNPSGSISIQIIDKSKHQYRVVQTLGCTQDPNQLAELKQKAQKKNSAIKKTVVPTFV